MAPPSPLTEKRIEQIAQDACEAALSGASAYAHASTATWNSSIINKILEAMISETSATDGTPPAYKFAVNSTIIQHQTTKGVDPEKQGRRGMHSAAGAYWNNEKDGMWSYKFEGGEAKGMDVVISVLWIAV